MILTTAGTEPHSIILPPTQSLDISAAVHAALDPGIPRSRAMAEGQSPGDPG
ncbi:MULTISPECIES: hypothetical protein [unclassified Microbacterium]|uniref:hypothetical protein n=1 Tax=unclassified Microbacterium TaxID=2609290 RepID=UPI00301ABCCF